MNLNNVNIENKNYIVGIYLRLSKDDGDKEESESITNQRKILKTFVKENNYTLYDEYIDDGYSGTNFNRPDFKRMIKDIENKKINMVITKNLARLGRDYIETGRYIETYFPEKEIRYIAVLDDVDTYLDRNCDTIAFKNIMNDFYAKETSKNIKKTKNRKKQEGFYYTSYAPFGYKKINKSGKLEIDEVSADTVKRIFKEFLNGKGTFQIAQLLNKEKVVTPGIYMNMTGVLKNITNTTNIWRHTTIKRILTNPIYIGIVVQNKRKKLSYKSKKMIYLPEEQHTITKNHHLPIIDMNTWNTVQSIFNNHKGSKISKNDPILKSLLYCAHCHNKLQIIKKQDKYKDKVKIRRYVICQTAIRTVSNRICYKQYSNYDILENKILDKISSVFKQYLNSSAFSNKQLVENLTKSRSKKGELLEKFEQITRQLNSVNKKLSTLYNDKLKEIIEEQDYILFSGSLVNERYKLEKLKETTQLELDKFEQSYDGKNLENKVEQLIKKVVEERHFEKEDLQQLVNKIEIDKDKNIVIYFNFHELNCLGGYFNYDNSESDQEAISS